MAVEEPKYSVVSREGDFEVRDYPGLVVAEVEVGGDRSDASSEGFRLLAGYIFGGNTGGESIAMTAPVTQAPAEGSRIAMTAPVTLSGDDGRWTVQFTMPSKYRLETLPVPNDPRVHLRARPPARTAVIKFSGLTGNDRVERQAERLADYLRRQKLKPTGKPSLARYDPPWTPWFLRRNELQVTL
jgi:hypothetical protein